MTTQFKCGRRSNRSSSDALYFILRWKYEGVGKVNSLVCPLVVLLPVCRLVFGGGKSNEYRIPLVNYAGSGM